MSMIKTYGGSGRWIKNSIAVSTLEEADIVIMPGGGDWNPSLYGHESFGTRFFNDDSDSRQMYTINKAIEKGKLLFGICRGIQGLTIKAGGYLIQDINHPGEHKVYTNDGRLYKMNSCHHQMCYPYELEKDDYKVYSWTKQLSPYYRVYTKDTFKFPKHALDKDGKFKEPEVIWYPKINALGCQGHPEWNPGKPALDYLNNLIIEKLNK